MENGALTQLFAGTMPEALNYNGEVMSCAAPLEKSLMAHIHISISSHGHASGSAGMRRTTMSLDSVCGHGLRTLSRPTRLPILAEGLSTTTQDTIRSTLFIVPLPNFDAVANTAAT